MSQRNGHRSVPLLVVVVLLSICCFSIQPASSTDETSKGDAPAGLWYTVWYEADVHRYVVGPGKDAQYGVAMAEWADERYVNGWTRFNLQGNSRFNDAVMAYGSGYLEGVLTAPLIWDAWYNWVANEWNGTVPAVIANFFQSNILWMNAQIVKNGGSDPYWNQVSLVLEQLKGMHAGYNSQYLNNTAQQLDIMAFHILNAGGDLETIQDKFNIGNVFTKNPFRNTHCSSLVKVTPDLQEMYAGHTTWTDYYNMLRSYKSYNLPFAAAGTAAKNSMFSSYPASLSSTDDFYQLSNNLVVMETTNGVWNTALYNLVQPSSVLSWIRVIVANKMATDGKSWVQVFSKFNSGTYNNQWIVVDYNKFVPGKPLGTNVLWIAEQIPGLIESADMTSVLEYGYWPSYNVPFFPKIFNTSGWNTAVQQQGPMLSYSWAPRAQIFRRDANKVSTLEDFKNILRYNNWKSDPLSYGDPGNQISSRFDLEPVVANRGASGGIDSKVTSVKLLAAGQSLAQSGPTHDSVPPFNWKSANWGVSYHGLPSLWNFGWVSMPSGAPVQ